MRLVALFMCACAGGPPATSWTDVPATRDVVTAAACDARARGLSPVLYLRADWTMASTRLVAMRDTPELREALRGLAVIAIDPDDDSPYAPLRRGYWHSLHALGADVELDPGTKDGPCADRDAARCADWLRPFAISARR
jgi:hypothetical protein